MQDLNLGELLDNPPPGIDEAVAISRVIRFLRNPDYGQFRAVVFDTAPTGHTLRLLTLPDFFNTGIGKLVRLRFTISNAIGRVTNFFSRKKESGRAVDKAMAKLEELQVRAARCSAVGGTSSWSYHVCRMQSRKCATKQALRDSLRMIRPQEAQVIVQGAMEEARKLFRDKERTEFVIVTIPTVMAMAESERLAASLEKERVPCKRIVVNQIVRHELCRFAAVALIACLTASGWQSARSI